MRTLLGAAIVIVVAMQSAYAGEWFNDIGSQMGRVEKVSNGDIWLMRPSSDLTKVTMNGCTFNQVKITPPAGLEETYLSMVLAAAMAGKPINVFGECGTDYVVSTNRLVLEY